jgi:hypothetical protein
MRYALSLTMVALLALAGGCNNQSDNATAGNQPAAATAPVAQTAAHELTPEQLGALGAQIRKEPGRAEALLTEHGLTRQTFEAQIRKVTENPDASKRYAEAYRKASA